MWYLWSGAGPSFLNFSFSCCGNDLKTRHSWHPPSDSRLGKHAMIAGSFGSLLGTMRLACLWGIFPGLQVVLSAVDVDTRLSIWAKERGTERTPAAFVIARTIMARWASFGDTPTGIVGSTAPLNVLLRNSGSGAAAAAPNMSVVNLPYWARIAWGLECIRQRSLWQIWQI